MSWPSSSGAHGMIGVPTAELKRDRIDLLRALVKPEEPEDSTDEGRDFGMEEAVWTEGRLLTERLMREDAEVDCAAVGERDDATIV